MSCFLIVHINITDFARQKSGGLGLQVSLSCAGDPMENEYLVSGQLKTEKNTTSMSSKPKPAILSHGSGRHKTGFTFVSKWITWLYSRVMFICALLVSLPDRVRGAKAVNDIKRAQVYTFPEKKCYFIMTINLEFIHLAQTGVTQLKSTFRSPLSHHLSDYFFDLIRSGRLRKFRLRFFF